MIVFACLSPHPPILLPHIGSPDDRAKVAKTISALESLASKMAESKPEIIIITSPHAEWGINVPLFFLRKKINDLKFNLSSLHPAESVLKIPDSKFSIFPILTAYDSHLKHYEWGLKIGQNLPPDKNIAWIASGDLSHRLKEDGPYGFHPSGPKFDQDFINLLKKKDTKGILDLPPQLIEEAGECGLRSFCMLLGALAGSKTSWQPEVLSYEEPFGVGYLVANFKLEK